jgi:hypothetical protein
VHPGLAYYTDVRGDLRLHGSSRLGTLQAGSTLRETHEYGISVLPDSGLSGVADAGRMTLHPRNPTDLMLAPVAASVDLNLQSLRDKPPTEIDYLLALELNLDTKGSTPADRTRWVLEAALRNVDLHDWQAEITDDGDRLRLEGGSVTLDLGLSATILRYIEQGTA